MADREVSVENGSVRIGPYWFDPESGDLVGRGRRGHLRPQTAEVLALLAARRGELVRRAELRELLWPAAPRSADAALNTCIQEIRAALDDPASAPRYVVTIPRRGYRLEAAEAVKALTAPRRWSRSVASVGVAAASALALVAAVWIGGGRTAPVSTQTALLGEARTLLETPSAQSWRRGLDRLDRLLVERPGYAPALADAAYGHLRLGELEAARGLSLRAIEADPLHPRANLVAGLVAMLADRDFEAARASLETARRLDPGDARAILAHGYLAVLEGAPPGDAAVRSALAVRSGTPMVTLDAAYLHLLLGSVETARELCSRLASRGVGPAERCLRSSPGQAGRGPFRELFDEVRRRGA